MEENLEYIDAYFQRMLDPKEIKRFEQKITEDKEFADEVAFYLSAKQSLKAEADREKKEWFRELLAQRRPIIDMNQHRSANRIWLYRVSAVAAVLICVFLAWNFFFSSNSATPQQMADDYINKDLSVKMTADPDSIQNGLRLYNNGQYDSALIIFEAIRQRDTGNYLIKNYLGIIYLRLGNYDKALQYFQAFEHDTLEANPSQINQALTLLKRNLPGDKQKAKELLQQVNDNDLEGKDIALKLLDKW